MSDAKPTVSQLNASDRDAFVRVCGSLFEHSPWIAERTWAKRPFASRDALHAALVTTMNAASIDDQVRLIASHPDLVGRLAREGQLTSESTQEQKAAGLDALLPEDVAAFDRFNAAYRDKFGFPFVICARENRKAAILEAFPRRLAQPLATEIATALVEIAKIARLRLMDAVQEG